MPEFEVKNLKELLSDHINGDFIIVNQTSKYLTAPGEHYGSIMLAMDLTIKKTSTGKQEVLNLVAKLLPASDVLQAAFDSGITFKKEIDAYNTTIPALIQFQRDYKVPEHKLLDIFAKCYGARISLSQDVVDQDAVLIFENLKVQGYDTGDRFIGFDLEHAKLIVQDLAKFHAVPIAMRILRPKEFDEKVGPSIVPNNGIETLPEDLAAAFRDSVIEKAKLIPELKPYVEKIKRLVLEAEDDAKNKNQTHITTPFSSITHSDYWVNNTMILQDSNGKPIKNIMVDLQIMQFDSALRDLVFFLFTSVINSVLDAHYDELIKLYYDTFIDNLKDFKIDLEPYSWDKYLIELEDAALKEFHHVTFMLKPIFTEKGKINDLANFQPSDWGRSDLIGPAHLQKLKDTLLAYIKRNWL